MWIKFIHSQVKICFEQKTLLGQKFTLPFKNCIINFSDGPYLIYHISSIKPVIYLKKFMTGKNYPWLRIKFYF